MDNSDNTFIKGNLNSNGRMKNQISKPLFWTWFIRFAGLLIISGTATLYVYLFYDRLDVIWTIKFNPFLYLIAGMTAMIFTTGLTNALLLKILGVELSFIEYSSLSFLTTFANYFGPMRAGAAVRASYLKIVKGLPVSAYAGVMMANSFLLMFVSGVVGVTLLFVGWLSHDLLSVPLMLICLAFICIGVAIKIVKLPTLRKDGRLWNIFKLALNGLDDIRNHKLGLTQVILSILLQYVAAAFILYFAYGAVGERITVLIAFIVGVFTAMSSYITITPNNIGLQEAVIGYLGVVTGIGLNESLLAAALVRAGQMVVVFVLSPVCWYLLLRPAGLTFSGRPKPTFKSSGEQ